MAVYHLGLSTSGHDPALALVDEAGRVAFAEATERFVQDKRAWGIAPDHISHLMLALDSVGFEPASDQLQVACSWSKVKAELPVQLSGALLPASTGQWLRELQAGLQRVAGASLLRLDLSQQMPEVRRFDHHLCHAVTAALFAPVDNAACLVIDGEGEVGAVSLYELRERSLKRRWRSWGPGSLGTFYGWLTALCGFDWRLGEEWKVMGLAAYGQVDPELRALLSSTLRIDNGRPIFADDAELHRVQDLLRPMARAPGSPVEHAAVLAASGQAAWADLADQVLAACLPADNNDALRNLILSGGCALNSSYNGTIAGRAGFDRVFVPPAPADDGNAIGAAILSWMQSAGTTRIPTTDGSAFLGSAASASARARLDPHQLGRCSKVSDLGGHSAAEIARRLAAGKIIGVMRGRAEFGPRALGNRSILADPRAPDMKERINRDVKGREAYRPFAPVIAEDAVADWFERPQRSPYMSFTLPWRQQRKSRVPAVVHADGTGRLQTVSPTQSPWMAELTREFGALTGVPIVLNTSFNVMGKPIIHSIEDALAVFMTSGLDAVLIDELLIEK